MVISTSSWIQWILETGYCEASSLGMFWMIFLVKALSDIPYGFMKVYPMSWVQLSLIYMSIQTSSKKSFIFHTISLRQNYMVDLFLKNYDTLRQRSFYIYIYFFLTIWTQANLYVVLAVLSEGGFVRIRENWCYLIGLQFLGGFGNS